jgi:hypothetical protein
VGRSPDLSGIGPWVEERKRIEEELEAVAKEARALDASGPYNAALRAAALLAVKLGAFYEHKEAPAVLRRCSRSPERRRLGEPCKARGGGFRAALFAVYAERAAVFRDPRQPMKPRPAKPNSSMAHVDGSGTPPVGPPRKPLPL